MEKLDSLRTGLQLQAALRRLPLALIEEGRYLVSLLAVLVAWLSPSSQYLAHLFEVESTYRRHHCKSGSGLLMDCQSRLWR